MILTSNQVKLRAYTTSDYDEIKYWFKGNQEWKKWDAPYFAKPVDEAVDAVIDRQIEKDTIYQGVPFSLVIANATTDTFIGEVTRYWICKRTAWVALGIIIYDPIHWGKGYATDAMGLWENYLWQQLPDSWRFDIETWSGNKGMMRVAEKLGYQLEGKFTNARRVNGQYYDSLRYGKLRDSIY